MDSQGLSLPPGSQNVGERRTPTHNTFHGEDGHVHASFSCRDSQKTLGHLLSSGRALFSIVLETAGTGRCPWTRVREEPPECHRQNSPPKYVVTPSATTSEFKMPDGKFLGGAWDKPTRTLQGGRAFPESPVSLPVSSSSPRRSCQVPDEALVWEKYLHPGATTWCSWLYFKNAFSFFPSKKIEAYVTESQGHDV